MLKGLRAGDLDRRITIQRASATRDALNNPIPAWSDLAEVKASKREVSDAERRAAQENAAEISTRFQIHWSPTVADINPKDRVIYDAIVHEIVAVKELGRRQGLEISCVARPDEPAITVAGD